MPSLYQNGQKLGQIGPIWDKAGTFIQIRLSKFWFGESKFTESYLKKSSGPVPFGANLTQFGSNMTSAAREMFQTRLILELKSPIILMKSRALR